jgi:MFS family permease
MRRRLLNPNFPFSPARVPFYYGWVILVTGTIGMAGMVPASPPGMAPFVEPMIEAFGLSRSGLNIAYMLGTVLAGVLTIFSGRLVDRYGPRLLSTAAFILLGLSLIYLSVADRIFLWLGGENGWVGTAQALLLAGFFGARFFGLGLLATAARTMIVRWFAEKRSIAVAFNGAAISLCFSSAPAALAFLVAAIGWRESWMTLGLIFTFGFAAFTWLAFRDSPEQTGVPIEGSQNADGSQREDIFSERAFPVHRDFTVAQAARMLPFWAYLLGLIVNGLIGTGIVFNLESIGAGHGLSTQHTFALLVPSGLVNASVSTFFAFKGSRLPTQPVLMVMLAAIAVEITGVLNFGHVAGQIAFFTGSGVAWGCFGILLNLPWPRYFGRSHLGALQGVITGGTIAASALGPLVFALGKEEYGGYGEALFGCLFMLLPIMVLAAFVRNPQRKWDAARGEDAEAQS